jgi:hypothetical protein
MHCRDGGRRLTSARVRTPQRKTLPAGFEISRYFATAGNRKKNKSDIKTAWRLLGEPVDFFPLFSRLVQVRTAFENGKQLADPTQKYSLSSQLGMVQAFTNITNVFKDLDLPPETMRDLNRLYKLYKLRADRREIEQFTNNKDPILSYPEYLAAVLEEYKRPSREFLIASLYSEFPARDNFGMTVTTSLNERKATRPRTGSSSRKGGPSPALPCCTSSKQKANTTPSKRNSPTT